MNASLSARTVYQMTYYIFLKEKDIMLYNIPILLSKHFSYSSLDYWSRWMSLMGQLLEEEHTTGKHSNLKCYHILLHRNMSRSHFYSRIVPRYIHHIFVNVWRNRIEIVCEKTNICPYRTRWLEGASYYKPCTMVLNYRSMIHRVGLQWLEPILLRYGMVLRENSNYNKVCISTVPKECKEKFFISRLTRN